MDYMERALSLARLALGSTSPNPAVGAVIAKDGVIIGEGYTQPPGAAHAVAISAGHVYVTDLVAGLAVFNECEGPVFADDFESGDTSAWSMTVP